MAYIKALFSNLAEQNLIEIAVIYEVMCWLIRQEQNKI